MRTDRQTDRQTERHEEAYSKYLSFCGVQNAFDVTVQLSTTVPYVHTVCICFVFI